MTTPCAPEEHDVHWYPEAANEAGWRCCTCGHKPGEPPGFDPQRDRDEIARKVWATLHDMHDAKIVYISNGSMGDGLTADIAARCRSEGVFDSYSIALFVLESLTPSHAKYWREVSEGILAGKDPRKRCWCGALSTCSSSSGGGPWVHRCNAHVGTEDPQLGLDLGEVTR
jgi:hypothetical protein